MFRLMTMLLFKINGWKLILNKESLSHYKKFILIGAPHTSNWDAIYFTAAATISKLKPQFLIKKSWMKFPFNIIFRPLGGIGVDNKKTSKKSSGIIEYMVNLFNKRKELIIMISPEGTRSKNPNWRTGFYRTAVAAKVPIVLGYLDYNKKTAGISEIFLPTGNINEDLLFISNFYKQFTGKNHELFAEYKPSE